MMKQVWDLNHAGATTKTPGHHVFITFVYSEACEVLKI